MENEEEKNKLVVYKDVKDVKIRSNARDIPVNICKLREKIKTVKVKNGSVVAMVLDKAGLDVDASDVDQLDLRVNGKKASLLQVVSESDTIYIASRVAGAM